MTKKTNHTKYVHSSHLQNPLLSMVFLKKLSIVLGMILLLFLSNIQPVYAQKNPQYTITDIHYNIKGSILVAAIEERIELQKNITFQSLEELIRYVQNKRTILSNLRQLTNMSTILFSHKWNPHALQYDIELFVYATAGNNLLILPYFKYTTSQGLLLSARGRDYNFLGSLETFYINLDYNLSSLTSNPDDIFSSSKSEHEFGISFGLQYPIKYKKNIFKIILEDSMSFAMYNAIFSNQIKTGLEYSRILTQQTTLKYSMYQWFNSTVKINSYDENSKTKKYTSGENEFQVGIGIQLTKIPQPFVHNIYYTPFIKYTPVYPLDGIESDDPNYHTRLNNIFTVGHNINFGQRKWIPSGFFRKGFTFSMGNDYAYNDNNRILTIDIFTEIINHYALGNSIGINLRGYAVQNFFIFSSDKKDRFRNNIDISNKGTNLGGRLRGVLDSEFDTVYRGFIINSDIMFKLFSIRPLAEFHIGILFDFAMREQSSDFYGTTTWNADENIKATIGIEGLAHALFSNSIVIRASYGIDLGKIIRDGTYDISNREIFIGLSLFY